MAKDKLVTLGLQQAMKLGQAILTNHEDLMRHRDTPLTSPERTELSDSLKSAVSQQHEWLVEILSVLDGV